MHIMMKIQHHEQAAQAENRKITVFQIFYREEQKPDLDPDFIAYDNKKVVDHLLEFSVFERLQASREIKKGILWGAVSWKFTEKTGLSGRDLFAFIEANPGFDVYYCNPHPQFEAIYHNLWLQGETAHPDFIKLARRFFKYASLSEAALNTLEPASAFASTNYLIGNAKFWRAYLAFVRSVLDRVTQHAPAKFIARLNSSAADAKGVHAGANYWPFIVERLFAVFLDSLVGKSLRACKYACPGAEERLTIHERRLREMKEVAITQKSPWMLSCWLNYRNLYLVQRHGRVWALRYLPRLLPKNNLVSKMYDKCDVLHADLCD